ncbi:MAG: biotin--[acetyl-CoA-carboxylase] ligase [marine benthic group bacterium]|nr:biotin--[acetyl-CoA-carboxylase] ligase [Candidatus Benthicola marisminoris]
MSRRTINEWAGESLDSLRARWNRESVFLYGKIDSTNEAARILAEDGAPAGTVLVCREQTAGRGRGGNDWHSPRDAGLYLSMVLRPADLSHPAMISILAGLGIVEELDSAHSGLKPGLKWPNDLVAGGLKIGGVLAEASWAESRPRYLVVGVGINVRPLGPTAPDDLAGRASSLDSQLGEAVPLLMVADATIRGLETWLPDAPASLEGGLLARVDRYDWLRDRRARLTMPGDETSQPGTCVGIAPDGALLFRPDRGALRRVTDAVVDPWA